MSPRLSPRSCVSLAVFGLGCMAQSCCARFGLSCARGPGPFHVIFGFIVLLWNANHIPWVTVKKVSDCLAITLEMFSWP